MNDRNIAELVSRAFLFQDLALDASLQVVQAAHTRAVSRSEFYFHQGEPATTLYVLLEGKARLLQVSAEGSEVLLEFIAPGQMFGGVSFLGQADYSVSAQTVEDCAPAPARLFCEYTDSACRTQARAPRAREQARGNRAGANTFVRQLRERSGGKSYFDYRQKRKLFPK